MGDNKDKINTPKPDTKIIEKGANINLNEGKIHDWANVPPPPPAPKPENTSEK